MDIDILGAGIRASGRARSVDLSWAWLRDHCDDSGSVDQHTGQRLIDTFGNESVDAPQVSVSDDCVALEWPDVVGSVSIDRLADLLEVPDPLAGGRALRTVDHDPVELWDGDRPLSDSTPLDAAEVIEGAAAPDLVERLAVSGLAVLEGAEPGEAAIEAIVSKIGYVRRTIFGAIWELAADVTGHADSAYSTTFLGPHTDATYMHDAPGVQVFACQERDGTGGESIVVDGFAAADRLLRENPRAVELLSSYDVPGRYVEPGVNLVAERAPLKVDARGRLVQVSFNNYDRAPFHLGAVDAEFRDAYASLGAEVNNEAHWHRIHWQPGRVLLIDNWRLLHARGSYTGARRFLGAYLNHEDLESAVRLQG